MRVPPLRDGPGGDAGVYIGHQVYRAGEGGDYLLVVLDVVVCQPAPLTVLQSLLAHLVYMESDVTYTCTLKGYKEKRAEWRGEAMILSEEQMWQMNEAELRRMVIMPLMEKMGYRGVFEWHGGAGELGKDVVGWRENDLGTRRNRAVVAKADRISGAQAVGVVATQVNQAFNTSFRDPTTGEEQRVHECWIVTNQRVGKEAREAIRAALSPEKNPYVEILDGEDLWQQVRKYLPVELYQVLDEVQKRLASLDTDYGAQVQLSDPGRPFAYLESEGRRVAIVERYPGQLEDKPFIIQTSFEFPDTPEGRTKLEELKVAMATGAMVEIPGEYVRVKSPEIIDQLSEQLLGVKSTETLTLEISSGHNPNRVPVRVDIHCDDGDGDSLDYVEWRVVQDGTDEITLANDAQPISIRVVHVVNLKDRNGNLTIGRKPGPIAAPVLLHLLKLQTCFSKPCRVTITLLQSGLPLTDARKESSSCQAINPGWVAVVADLAAIQEKVGRPIYIPDREFTRDEWEMIAELRRILQRRRLHAGGRASRCLGRLRTPQPCLTTSLSTSRSR